MQQLIDEGFEAEVRQQYLLVHSVPYVAPGGVVKHATLACKYVVNAGQVQPPDNHQVWFTGEQPCKPDGSVLSSIGCNVQSFELFPGFTVQRQFSNKPEGASGFSDYTSKMKHYIALLSDQARALDLKVDARTRRVIESTAEDSVFRYEDTASTRAEITAISARLTLPKIAIVGLGGTGAYILDQVAKTPVKEVHLFDGDRFLQHNAFRGPGAASLDELRQRPFKVTYWKNRYDPMRRELVEHPYHLTEANITELAGFAFVFVCVDSGPARRLICMYLKVQGIPFVDTGIDVQAIRENNSLVGQVRFTLATRGQYNHLEQYLPIGEDAEDAAYRQNIQVSDLNAIAAQHAVIQWKQFCGFYQDDFHSHQGVYTVSAQSLTRDAMPPGDAS
jgi:hypothetical protein